MAYTAKTRERNTIEEQDMLAEQIAAEYRLAARRLEITNQVISFYTAKLLNKRIIDIDIKYDKVHCYDTREERFAREVAERWAALSGRRMQIVFDKPHPDDRMISPSG